MERILFGLLSPASEDGSAQSPKDRDRSPQRSGVEDAFFTGKKSRDQRRRGRRAKLTCFLRVRRKFEAIDIPILLWRRK